MVNAAVQYGKCYGTVQQWNSHKKIHVANYERLIIKEICNKRSFRLDSLELLVSTVILIPK